jgi:hypothetical protein
LDTSCLYKYLRMLDVVDTVQMDTALVSFCKDVQNHMVRYPTLINHGRKGETGQRSAFDGISYRVGMNIVNISYREL